MAFTGPLKCKESIFHAFVSNSHGCPSYTGINKTDLVTFTKTAAGCQSWRQNVGCSANGVSGCLAGSQRCFKHKCWKSGDE